MGIRCEKARLTSNVLMTRNTAAQLVPMAGVMSNPKHATRGDRRSIITIVANVSHVYENGP